VGSYSEVFTVGSPDDAPGEQTRQVYESVEADATHGDGGVRVVSDFVVGTPDGQTAVLPYVEFDGRVLAIRQRIERED
jgi:hypothetical protein